MRNLGLVIAGTIIGVSAVSFVAPSAASSGIRRSTVVAYGTHPVAHCPRGYTVTGGGVHPVDAGSPVTNSQPSHNGWTGSATYYDKVTSQTIADTVDVYAICVRR